MTAETKILQYEPRHAFDAGLLVARYLQGLAWVSIGWMVLHPILYGGLHVDLSFLFMLWAAAALKRRSGTARKWTIGISGVVVGLCVTFALKAAFFGTEGIRVSLGRRIDNPAPWQVLLAAGLIAVVAAVPLVVLTTKRARVQFAVRSV